MAVVTSHALAPLHALEPNFNMATVVESEVRNGSVEVNGHASANGVPASTESATEPKAGDEVAPAKPADASHKQNHDAFATNRNVTDKSKSESGAKSGQEMAMADAEATSSQKDGKMGKELAEGASGASQTEQSADKIKLDVMEVDRNEKLEDAVVDDAKETAKEPENCEHGESLVKDEASPKPSGDPSPSKDIAAEPPAESGPDAAMPADSTVVKAEDIDMTDAPVTDAPVTDNAMASQSPAADAEEANTQESALSTAIDSSHNSPAAPATADTSMSDLAPTKLSREREDDDTEQPRAKRAKTDAELQAKSDEAQVPAAETKDPMDVDASAPGADTSLFLEDGQPKPLGHWSLDHTSITEYQNRQLRQVLAGVKKTKGGMNFRASVQALWPGIWEEYRAKISHPMDLSIMEKKLRSDMTIYSNMAAFKQDLDLLVQNAITFNGEVHDVTQAAKNTRNSVLERMKAMSAVEPPKPDKKETAKQLPKRHTEPRVQAQPAPPPPPKPAKAAQAVQAAQPVQAAQAAAPPPVEKPIPESPAFAIPPNNNGVPSIRRDSTKTSDNRPKRPINPPARSKDLVYENRKRKKTSPEIKFCESVLEELTKAKWFDYNAPFMTPVDPVALNIPNYFKVIKKPMDLQTMSNKIANGDYSNAKEFEKDFNLMIKNARDYNGEGHFVVTCGVGLQNLFQEEWKRKDEFVAKLAPASLAATSPRQRDDSEDEDADSEAEPARDDVKASSDKLNYMLKRLADEQAKVNREMEAKVPDSYAVEVTQGIIATLQNQIIQERTRINEEASKAKPKSKPAKGKKAGGAGGAAAGAGKKTAGGAGGGGKKAGGGKRAAAKRKMNPFDKEVIAHGISDLDGPQLEKAIDIIKKDTGQGENDSGELELDIEVLSNDALVRLYEIVTKAFPGLVKQKERERGLVAEPAADTTASSPPAKTKSATAKSKKNKPMSKSEQERRIAQLSQLRAAAQRHGSGSQEPMESIEGNGVPPSAISETAPPAALDSAEEESSEEE